MIKSIVAIVIIVTACAQSTSRSDDASHGLYLDERVVKLKKTDIDGTTCVVASHHKGLAISCDWGK